MQEMTMGEVEQVNGGIRQMTGFVYYLLSGGDIIFMDDTGERYTFSF